MKSINAFFVSAFCGVLFFQTHPSFAQGLRFTETPSVRRFADGAIEWFASISCADPTLLLGSRLTFSLDGNVDGVGDTAGSAALSPADCEGDRLSIRRGFFPSTPAVLRAELRAELKDTRAGSSGSLDSVTDVHSLLTGEAGTLLSLRRFCARPKNGEPEWIEVRNGSTVTISLAKIRVEGRALTTNATAAAVVDTLTPGESLTAVAAADTAEIRLWQPGARILPLSSWPGLRNTGDTLRLSVDVKSRDGSTVALVLDSIVYGAGVSPREACASVPTEESGASAHGFGLELPPGRWKRRAGSWRVAVTAPVDAAYDLRVYDLDGLELCALTRGAVGPQVFSLSVSTCGRLSPVATAALLQLQPRRAPSVRRLLWITP